MDIKIKNYKTIYILDIYGEIDLYNYSKLKQVVDAMTVKGIKNFILNLENVTYIDSSGIGAIIYVVTALKKTADCRISICGVHGPVKRVIELTKLTNFLPLAENLQESIKKINSEDKA